MKFIHVCIIGVLMLIFAWSTLLIEGKKNKGSKAGKFFKKVGKIAKDVGKTALAVIKDPRKGIALAKDGIKSARGAKGKPKKVPVTNKMCISNWSTCSKQVNKLYGDDEMTKQYETSICHQNYLECIRQI